MSFHDTLKNIYFDPAHSAGFGTEKELYQAVKPLFPSTTHKQIKKWLNSQDSFSLHKKVIRKFTRRKTLSRGLNYQIQMDLVDLSNIKKFNNNYRYLLVAINIFSRKLFVVPLKTKSGHEVVEAIKEIFSKTPIPKHIQTDRGSEFYNKFVKNYFNEQGINHFSSDNYDIKAAVVERVNRTLKDRMFKYFTYNSTLSYLPVLDELVDSYNNRFHTSIGTAPNKVNTHNEKQIWKYQYFKHLKLIPQKCIFKKGDIVRISKFHKMFKKGYLPNFKEEYFMIEKCLKTIPPVYHLKDNTGSILVGKFYKEELAKVNPLFFDIKIIKKRKKGNRNEFLVHLKGTPSDQDKWMSTHDLKQYETGNKPWKWT